MKRSRLLTFAWAIALVLASAVTRVSAEAEPPKAKEDAELIQGTWTIESAGDLKGGTIVFANGTLRMRFPGAKDEHEGSFKLNPGENPKQIDMHMKGGEPNVGIYVLDGDTLRIFAVPGTERPATFPEKSPALMLLKRTKP